MDITWVTIESPNRRKFPAWKLSSAMDEKGTIFAPADICGPEKAVFLAASYDGEEALLWRRHIFLPTAWLKENFPEYRDVMESIERRMRAVGKVARGSGSHPVEGLASEALDKPRNTSL